ncbi:MAG: hypothetical protein ACRCUS_04950 [Anaerovoracaceae bacterium]
MEKRLKLRNSILLGGVLCCILFFAKYITTPEEFHSSTMIIFYILKNTVIFVIFFEYILQLITLYKNKNDEKGISGSEKFGVLISLLFPVIVILVTIFSFLPGKNGFLFVLWYTQVKTVFLTSSIIIFASFSYFLLRRKMELARICFFAGIGILIILLLNTTYMAM